MLAASIIVFFVLLLIGVPVTHVVLGAAATGILGSGAGPSILVQQSVLGINSYTTLAVPFFIIAGDLASKGKTSEKIVNVINAFLGRIPGGLGIATIVACAFFGAITGSSMATVVAIGSIMLPKLTEAGYPRLLSIGIVTCAGTLGVMIPPSIPMLLIAIALRTSVGAQFTAGILPGLLTAAAMSAYVFFYAKKHKLPLAEKVPFKQKLRVVKESLFALLFPVIVLGSIYSGIATPTESAVISVLYILVIELFVYREIRPRQLHAMFGASAVSAATMTVMMATAQVFVIPADQPLLSKPLLASMYRSLGGEEALLPLFQKRVYPLHGFYRRNILGKVEDHLRREEYGLTALCRTLSVQYYPEEQIRLYDPNGVCLKGANTPKEYQELLRMSEALRRVGGMRP